MRHGIPTLISWKTRKSEICKLILKMMMLNTLLLSIFQSVFVITLPENKKLICDEKEGQLQLIRLSPAAIDDEV